MVGALVIELISNLLDLDQQLIVGLLHLLENFGGELVGRYCQGIILILFLPFYILRNIRLSFRGLRS